MTCAGTMSLSTRTSGSWAGRPSGREKICTPKDRAISPASAAEPTFSLPSLSNTRRRAPAEGKLAMPRWIARAMLVEVPSTCEVTSDSVNWRDTPCSSTASAPKATRPMPSCGGLCRLTARMKSSACWRAAAATLCDMSNKKTTLTCWESWVRLRRTRPATMKASTTRRTPMSRRRRSSERRRGVWRSQYQNSGPRIKRATK